MRSVATSSGKNTSAHAPRDVSGCSRSLLLSGEHDPSECPRHSFKKGPWLVSKLRSRRNAPRSRSPAVGLACVTTGPFIGTSSRMSYAWAGRFRTSRIAKEGSMFCYPEFIEAEMRALFDRLRRDRYLRELSAEEFAEQASAFLSTLNAIHPFRDGNGRTQLTFMALFGRSRRASSCIRETLTASLYRCDDREFSRPQRRAGAGAEIAHRVSFAPKPSLLP